MEDAKVTRVENNRWIVTTIRVMMIGLFGAYLSVVTLSWGFAFWGDLDLLFDWIDHDFEERPETWRIIVGFALDLLPIASLASVFWSVHRFFMLLGQDQYFDFITTRTISRLGWSLVFVWGTIFFSELMHLFLIEPIDPEDELSAIDFLPIDTEAIFLFLGLVFIAMASILVEARLVDEENKEIV